MLWAKTAAFRNLPYPEGCISPDSIQLMDGVHLGIAMKLN